jgi:hypothetical protein
MELCKMQKGQSRGMEALGVRVRHGVGVGAGGLRCKELGSAREAG